MYTYLMMTSGPKVGASALLHETADPIRLGRQSDCQLQLEDPLCSRHHAEIWFENGHWHIRDLSRNGTFVNGVRITQHELSDGDTIRMGHIEFDFHESDQPPTTVERLELGGPPLVEAHPEDEQTLQASLSGLSAAALDYKELNRLAAAILHGIGRELPDWEPLVLEFMRARLGAARAAWFEVDENFQLIPRRLDPPRQPRPELSASLKYLLLSEGRAVWASHQSPTDARRSTQKSHGTSDALWAPLALHGEIVGVLYAGLEIGQFRQSQFDLALALAMLASEALRLEVESLAAAAAQRAEVGLAGWPDQLPGNSPAAERLRSRLADAAHQPVAALRAESGCELPVAVKLLHGCRRGSGSPLLVASAEAFNAAAAEEGSPPTNPAPSKPAPASRQAAALPPSLSQQAQQQALRPRRAGVDGASLLFSRRLWRLLRRGRGSGAVLWLTNLQRLSPAGQERLLHVLHLAEQSPPASVPIEQQPLSPPEAAPAITTPPRFWLVVSLDAAADQPPLLPELAAALAPRWIDLPPLRERTADLEPWLDWCLAALRAELGRPQLFVTPAARAVLLARPWPGNVAELQAVLKAAALRSAGDAVDVAHLDPTGAAAEAPYDTLQWATWEHRLIDAALHQSGGNSAEAARLLGIGRATLYRKLEAKDSPAIDEEE